MAIRSPKAVAEELRLKAQELSGQIFEFAASTQVNLPAYRPTVTKCHYDKLYHWPGPFSKQLGMARNQKL